MPRMKRYERLGVVDAGTCRLATVLDKSLNWLYCCSLISAPPTTPTDTGVFSNEVDLRSAVTITSGMPPPSRAASEFESAVSESDHASRGNMPQTKASPNRTQAPIALC